MKNSKGDIIIEIVKKLQESSDTGMHTEPLLVYMNSGCVIDSRHTPTVH